MLTKCLQFSCPLFHSISSNIISLYSRSRAVVVLKIPMWGSGDCRKTQVHVVHKPENPHKQMGKTSPDHTATTRDQREGLSLKQTMVEDKLHPGYSYWDTRVLPSINSFGYNTCLGISRMDFQISCCCPE